MFKVKEEYDDQAEDKFHNSIEKSHHSQAMTISYNHSQGAIDKDANNMNEIKIEPEIKIEIDQTDSCYYESHIEVIHESLESQIANSSVNNIESNGFEESSSSSSLLTKNCPQKETLNTTNSINGWRVITQHKRLRTREKPFKCAACLKCFSKKSYLTIHERVHTGEKPYKCAVCLKCFTKISDLKNHEHVHTGVKPFRCNECLKYFSLKGNLTKHERLHTGEKPFKCAVCFKCFSRKAHLIVHKRVHTVDKTIQM